MVAGIFSGPLPLLSDHSGVVVGTFLSPPTSDNKENRRLVGLLDLPDSVVVVVLLVSTASSCYCCCCCAAVLLLLLDDWHSCLMTPVVGAVAVVVAVLAIWHLSNPTLTPCC
jgi:hypothetical protein